MAKQKNRAERRAKGRQAQGSDGKHRGFVTEEAQAAFRRSSALAGPTAKHISAARSAAGRRTQAKRDAR